MSKIVITGLSDVTSGVDGFIRRRRTKVDAKMKWWASDLENKMKEGKPWTNRTSNAQGGLFAEWDKSKGALYLSHGAMINYGIWLEMANNGSYGIVKPTYKKYHERVIDDIKKEWSK